MSLPTFKQFLVELTMDIDVDPEADAAQQLQAVRKAQLMAKKSPERVVRAELNKAKEQKTAAATSTAPTAALETQIARKREEVYRLQQKLMMMKKREAAQAPQATELPTPGQM